MNTTQEPITTETKVDSFACPHSAWHAVDEDVWTFDLMGFACLRSREIQVCDTCDEQVNVEEFDYNED